MLDKISSLIIHYFPLLYVCVYVSSLIYSDNV